MRVLIPTRRPHRIADVRANLADVSPDVAVTVITDVDQDTTGDIVNPGPLSSWAIKINQGVAQTDDDVLVFAADDVVFHPGWDRAILDLIDDHAVVGTRDLMNRLVERGLHATHWAVRRDYIDTRGGTFDEVPGLALCEEYSHNYVDDEFIKLARWRGAFVHAAGAVLEHLHHLTGKSRDDEVYRYANSTKSDDWVLFETRMMRYLVGRVRTEGV